MYQPNVIFRLFEKKKIVLLLLQSPITSTFEISIFDLFNSLNTEILRPSFRLTYSRNKQHSIGLFLLVSSVLRTVKFLNVSNVSMFKRLYVNIISIKTFHSIQCLYVPFFHFKSNSISYFVLNLTLDFLHILIDSFVIYHILSHKILSFVVLVWVLF